MDAVTTFVQEETPAAWPEAPEGLPVPALWPVAWQRVEAYVAWRWAPRAARWIAEGPGVWRPTLRPADITLTEVWSGGEWLPIDLDPEPGGGFILPSDGAFRFTGTAGAGVASVPEAVTEAVRRLAHYLAGGTPDNKPGATSERMQVGDVVFSHERDAAWMAKALQNSGAADLLRIYRRA